MTRIALAAVLANGQTFEEIIETISGLAQQFLRTMDEGAVAEASKSAAASSLCPQERKNLAKTESQLLLACLQHWCQDRMICPFRKYASSH